MSSVEIEDASGYRGYADLVLTPETEDQLRDILIEAGQAGTPVTVSGAGTGITGGRVPDGGWLISLQRFRKLEIQDGQGIAGPAVLLRELQAAAAARGQFYAPDPTENSASIGGTIATNASGSRSFRYGDTRRHVLGLRVVTMDGSIYDLHRGDPVWFPVPEIPRPRTTKHTGGYLLQPGMDALDLFVGSEGTLGVVTESTLRLLPAIGESLGGVVFFGSEDAALDAVDAWRDIPGLQMLEYMDSGSVEMLRSRYPELTPAVGAALLVEQEGATESLVDDWLDRLESAGALAEQSWFGNDPKSRERFRQFRHALPEAVNETVRRRGLLKMGTDFAVPIERNREMMTIYRDRLGQEFPGHFVIFGHIGDAHLHLNVLPQDQEDSTRARRVIDELARQAVRLGGTVSAEHGLGKRKAHLLQFQYTGDQIESMKQVKRHLDPHWLLGRGTLFPHR